MSKKKKITIGQWSANEIRLLKELLPNKKLIEIAEKLKRSVGAVRRKRYSIGIRCPWRFWSAKEIQMVKNLFPHKGPQVIACKIGRSKDTINQKAYSMGLKRIGPRPYRPWSADEVALLKEVPPDKTLNEIAHGLGRSVETVRVKVRKMGLSDRYRQWRGRPWSTMELDHVKKFYPGKGPHKIAHKIGRSVASVKEKAYKMGLTIDGFRHWSSNELRLLKKAYPSHSDSKKLAKQFGRPLSAVRQRAYELGLTKEKRYHPWTSEETKLLKKLYQHGDVKDIADKLGRPPGAVVSKAGKLGLKKASSNSTRLGSWSKEDVRLLRKLYPSMTSRQISAQLGRPLKSVTRKVYNLGLKKQLGSP